MYLDEGLIMRLNSFAADDLIRLSLASGIYSFAAHLGDIHLPYYSDQHPDPHFIRLANSFRGLQS